MMEAKPPVAASTVGPAAAAAAEEDLHPVSWSELVAKLTAARELRAALAAGSAAAPASFDALSAQCLAAMHPLEAEETRANGSNAVNLYDSANRKGLCGTIRDDESKHRSAPRGNQ